MSFLVDKGKKASKRKHFENRGNDAYKMRKVKDTELRTGLTCKEKFGEMDMDEEAMLEKLVLGDISSMLAKLGDEDNEYPSLNIDSDDSGLEEGTSTPEDEPKPTTSGKQAAWQDEDDSLCIEDALISRNVKGKYSYAGKGSDAYSNHLKKHFHEVVNTPKWARMAEDDKNMNSSDIDSDDDVLRHANSFLSKVRSNLPHDILNIKRLSDLNSKVGTDGIMITSVQFHPKSTVALVAGLSGVAAIVQVDGEKNNKLHSVQFERFPISSAKFTPSGQEFLVGSRDLGHFYRYDLVEGRSLKIVPQTSSTITNFKHFQISPDGRYIAVAGRFGNIYILCARSNEFICLLKMNEEVTALTFNTDGSLLYAHGDLGEVYVWDLSSQTCLYRFTDDGCVTGTALAVSPNGQFLVTGSSHGVVNVYESSSLMKEVKSPKPTKILYNLTTSITALKFNSTSEILSMSSNVKDNAIRLVHFPSMTVFNNFPSWIYKIPRPDCTDFSLHSGYFSVTEKSRAYLFRLPHYGNY